LVLDDGAAWLLVSAHAGAVDLKTVRPPEIHLPRRRVTSPHATVGKSRIAAVDHELVTVRIDEPAPVQMTPVDGLAGRCASGDERAVDKLVDSRAAFQRQLDDRLNRANWIGDCSDGQRGEVVFGL
jgi:hypothetical protein